VPGAPGGRTAGGAPERGGVGAPGAAGRGAATTRADGGDGGRVHRSPSPPTGGVTGFRERRERPVHLEDGHHVAKLATEAAEKREHHLPIANGVAEFGEGGDHGLKAAAVVGDAPRNSSSR
jgi:hypothetical protein